MKRICLIIILFAIVCGNLNAQMAISVWSDDFADSFEGGDGAKDSPYIISTPEQLARLAVMVRDEYAEYADKHYRLSADIDLVGYAGQGGGAGSYYYWDLPVGSSQTLPFKGTFDGDNFSIISILTVSGWYSNGLFSYTNNAVIKNVKIENVSISNVDIAGSLVGCADNTKIENCSVLNFSITNINKYAGGLVGEARNSTIEKSSSSGKISCTLVGANNYTGGFAGYCNNVEFIDCFSEGELVGASAVGGFAGRIDGDLYCDVRNCYSTCKTFGTSNCIGGFIGIMNASWTKIVECRASGAVVGLSRFVGGFIGSIENTTNLMITDCISEGPVTGVDLFVGGFIGANYGKITVSGCRATGATEGLSDCVGGFVGYSQGGDDVVFSGCCAWGTVNGKNMVGGFVGQSYSDFTDCYAVGAVEGNSIVGGFAGTIDKTSNCYAVGTVWGNDIVGGFGGVMPVLRVGALEYMPPFDVIGCFAAGTVLCENVCGAFVGKTGSSQIGANYINCYFDKQTTGLVSASGDNAWSATDIRALTTSEFTNHSVSSFQPTKWILDKGYYPQLRLHAESADETTKRRSALSVIPLMLANDSEFIGDVQTFFRLADVTPAGNALIWTTNPIDRLIVVNNVLYGEASDEWRTLTLYAGDAARTVQFRSTKTLITADILNVKINNQTFDNIPAQYTYPIECESTDESVFVEIILGGYAVCTPGSPVTLFANQPQEITVTTEDNQTKIYTFVAEKRLHPDIFVQRWDDILAVNNNFTTNGGYNFTAYEWYKNGVKMSSTKGYIQEPGGLSKTAEYTVALTTQQGNKLNTCPAVIYNVKKKAAVYPNPVQRGQTVRVENEIGTGEKIFNATVIQFFDATGNIVAKQILQNPIDEIIAPDAAGTYILQITENDESQTFKIVVE